jgi:hypothetical protein
MGNKSSFVEVTFNEALLVWREKTVIKCEVFGGRQFVYSNFDALKDDKGMTISSYEILDGTWYMEVEEEAHPLDELGEELNKLLHTFNDIDCVASKCSDCVLKEKVSIPCVEDGNPNVCNILVGLRETFMK